MHVSFFFRRVKDGHERKNAFSETIFLCASIHSQSLTLWLLHRTKWNEFETAIYLKPLNENGISLLRCCTCNLKRISHRLASFTITRAHTMCNVNALERLVGLWAAWHALDGAALLCRPKPHSISILISNYSEWVSSDRQQCSNRIAFGFELLQLMPTIRPNNLIFSLLSIIQQHNKLNCEFDSTQP